MVAVQSWLCVHGLLNMITRLCLVPDSLVAQIVTDRLARLDCSTRGWVLRGFPANLAQAELLKAAGYFPNR